MSKANKRERQRMNREARREYEETLAKRRRRMKALRGFAIVAVPVIAIGVILSIANSGGDDSSDTPSAAKAAGCRNVKNAPAPKDETFPSAPPMTIDTTQTYRAVVETSCGSFTIDLAAAEAPQTVNSFVFLAQQGFYDGLDFHRIAKDFVVQGGDPSGDGTGGPGYTLPDEPPANGYQQGSVAMANSGPNTSGSQFFIVTSNEGAAGLGGPPYLYSILGQVTEGFETITKMNKLGSSNPDPGQQQPAGVVVIDKITIETGAPAAG